MTICKHWLVLVGSWSKQEDYKSEKRRKLLLDERGVALFKESLRIGFWVKALLPECKRLRETQAHVSLYFCLHKVECRMQLEILFLAIVRRIFRWFPILEKSIYGLEASYFCRGSLTVVDFTPSDSASDIAEERWRMDGYFMVPCSKCGSGGRTEGDHWLCLKKSGRKKALPFFASNNTEWTLGGRGALSRWQSKDKTDDFAAAKHAAAKTL